MKKQYFLIIILVSLFASQKLFNPQFYTSHDGGGHIIRLGEFDEALREGQFPVRLAKRINYGLGYPFFNFNYPLIYYLGEGIHLLGFSFVDSFKVLLILSVILGGLGIYLWLAPCFGELAALTSAIFYILVPYRFLNLYVRADVAESWGLAILPLVFLAIDRLFSGKKKLNFGFVTTAAILILCHNITALLGLGLAIAYFVFKLYLHKNKRMHVENFLTSLIVVLLLTAFFWLPAIAESSLTKLVELTEDYSHFFPSLRELIYSPWGFGAYKQGNIPGKMSVQIGLVQEAISIVALFVFLKHLIVKQKLKEQEKMIIFFGIVGLISLFFALPVSKPLWNNLPLFKYVQLPWRLVGYLGLVAAVAAGYFINQLKTSPLKFLAMITLLTALIYTNRNHIRVNQYINIENPFLASETYGPSTTSKDEHMPRLAPRVYREPVKEGEVMPPSAGSSQRLIWKSNYHLFEVKLATVAAFRDNTSYFPGWQAAVDGKAWTIDFKNDDYYRLKINLPAGIHRVEFFFGETTNRLIADLISILTATSLIIFAILSRFI